MGSFAAQQYVLDHSAELAGLVLTGTAVLDLLEPALNLDEPMDLSAFNAPFAPARTDFDWLSRDEAQVDAYVTDPLCGFGLSERDGKQMFLSARPLADPERLAGIRSDLPVLIGVGDQDPVNGQLALVHPFVERLATAGLSDVTLTSLRGRPARDLQRDQPRRGRRRPSPVARSGRAGLSRPWRDPADEASVRHMPAKLVVLYGRPDDPDAFDQHYREVHSPLVDRLPGLQNWDHAKFVASPDGGAVDYYQIAELHFADPSDIDAAFGSDEGKAAAADYGQIAPPGSRMFVAVS